MPLSRLPRGGRRDRRSSSGSRTSSRYRAEDRAEAAAAQQAVVSRAAASPEAVSPEARRGRRCRRCRCACASYGAGAWPSHDGDAYRAPNGQRDPHDHPGLNPARACAC